jgi:hypothetical protein
MLVRRLLVPSGMRRLGVLMLALAGCAGVDLDDVRDELDVYVGADIGAPSELVGQSALFHLSFNEPDHGCVFLDDSAQVLLDGVAAERFVREGISHAGCDGDEYELTMLPTARDVSEIELRDSSASVTIRVPQLLVNPAFESAGTAQRGTMTSVRILDERPIRSASVLWRAAPPGTGEWRTYAADHDTPGELRVMVPATAPLGPGTLAVEVTIYHGGLEDPGLCPGIASCQVNSRGGAYLSLTIE